MPGHPPGKRGLKIQIPCRASEDRQGCEPGIGCEQECPVHRSVRVILSEVDHAKTDSQDQRGHEQPAEMLPEPVYHFLMGKYEIAKEEGRGIKTEAVDRDDRRIQDLRGCPDRNRHCCKQQYAGTGTGLPEAVLFYFTDRNQQERIHPEHLYEPENACTAHNYDQITDDRGHLHQRFKSTRDLRADHPLNKMEREQADRRRHQEFRGPCPEKLALTVPCEI